MTLSGRAYWETVSSLVNTYQGFKYRKPILYVIWVCQRGYVSEHQLRRAEVQEEGNATTA